MTKGKTDLTGQTAPKERSETARTRSFKRRQTMTRTVSQRVLDQLAAEGQIAPATATRTLRSANRRLTLKAGKTGTEITGLEHAVRYASAISKAQTIARKAFQDQLEGGALFALPEASVPIAQQLLHTEAKPEYRYDEVHMPDGSTVRRPVLAVGRVRPSGLPRDEGSPPSPAGGIDTTHDDRGHLFAVRLTMNQHEVDTAENIVAENRLVNQGYKLGFEYEVYNYYMAHQHEQNIVTVHQPLYSGAETRPYAINHYMCVLDQGQPLANAKVVVSIMIHNPVGDLFNIQPATQKT